MESQKEWSILNMVKVQTVEPAREVESTDERTLICKERSVYEINCLCVFLNIEDVEIISQTNKNEKITFSMSKDLGELQNCISMPW